MCFAFAYVQLATRYMLAEMYAGLHVNCWFFLYDFNQNYRRTNLFPNFFYVLSFRNVFSTIFGSSYDGEGRKIRSK